MNGCSSSWTGSKAAGVVFEGHLTKVLASQCRLCRLNLTYIITRAINNWNWYEMKFAMISIHSNPCLSFISNLHCEQCLRTKEAIEKNQSECLNSLANLRFVEHTDWLIKLSFINYTLPIVRTKVTGVNLKFQWRKGSPKKDQLWSCCWRNWRKSKTR